MNQAFSGNPDRVFLESPLGVPDRFLIGITPGVAESGSPLTFTVTGPDPTTDVPKTKHFGLTSREHVHYMDMYAAIGHEFKIRIPQNRALQRSPVSEGEYTALVTDNLSSHILYGYGDPAVLLVDGADIGEDRPWYYLVSTSNDAPDAFPIIRSKDLKSWEPRGFIFPRGRTPGWAATGENVADYWAPELHKIGDNFVVYFVARHQSTRDLCIGFAISSHPEGPYKSADEPLLAGNKADPNVFIDSDAKVYLFWKEDRNAIWPLLLNELLFTTPRLIERIFDDDEDRRTASFIATLWPWTRTFKPMECYLLLQPLIEIVTSKFERFGESLRQALDEEHDNCVRTHLHVVNENLKTCVYIQQLDHEGVHLIGEHHKVLENDRIWEAHVVEGTWLAKVNNKYYMFYAGNDFSTGDYAIGVARADSPFGPFRKSPDAILRSTSVWSAPGHASLTIGPNGQPVLFFHAFVPGEEGYKHFRALLCVALDFKDEFPIPVEHLTVQLRSMK
jgi:hypothetical protein